MQNTCMSENITYVLQLLYYCIIIQLLYSIIIQYSSKNNAREIGKNHMSTTLNNNSSEESNVYKCTIIMIVCVPIKFNMHFSNTPCTHSILGLQN